MGRLKQGSIVDCYAERTVGLRRGSCRGPRGREPPPMTNCHATSTVSTDYDCAGGLVGTNFGSMTHCHATSTVSSDYNWAGGLVGVNYSASRELQFHCNCPHLRRRRAGGVNWGGSIRAATLRERWAATMLSEGSWAGIPPRSRTVILWLAFPVSNTSQA